MTVPSEREVPAVLPAETPEARRILWNTVYPLVANVGGKVATLALYVAMARKLGEDGFGVFTFGMAFAAIVTTLADFEQDKILTREVSRDRRLVDHYFGNTLVLKAALAVPAVTIGFVILLASGASAETREVFLLLATAVVAELLMATCFATFQSYERMVFVPVALLSQRFVTAIAGIVALLLGVGVVAVAAIYLCGALIGLFLAAGLLLTRVVRPRLEVEVRRWWPLMRAALPIGLAGVFSIVLFRVDTTMLASFKSDDVVGNYGAAYRLFEATLFLSWSVGAAVYPVLSRLTLVSEPSVGFVFGRGTKLLVALTLPFAAGAAILGRSLIELIYGDAYDDAGSALILLAPAIALFPVCYLTGYLLVSQHRQRVLTVVYGLVAAENILLNLVLIPWQSLYGAAVGTSISQALATVSLLLFARGATGRIEWARVVAGPLLATGLAAAAMALLHERLALAIVAGATTYLVTLGAFERIVFPDDASVAGRLLRRGRELGG